MINLFDWMQVCPPPGSGIRPCTGWVLDTYVPYLKAFIAVVQPDKLKEESKKKQEVEPALQYPLNVYH